MSFEGKKCHIKAWWNKNKKTVFITTGMAALAFASYYTYRKLKIPQEAFSNALAKTNTVPEVCCVQDVISTVICAVEDSAVVESSPKLLNNGLPFPVSGHPRNCSAGRHPSAAKVAFAAEQGISLAPNQTYVIPYMKNIA